MIYIIGAIFTLGILLAIEPDNEFAGFKGACLLIITCLFWPFFLGAILGEFIKQNFKLKLKDNKTDEVDQ